MSPEGSNAASQRPRATASLRRRFAAAGPASPPNFVLSLAVSFLPGRRGEARQVMRADQLAEAGLEDDMEKVDLATRADREWDAWKDAHPRGMGVTKRV